MGQKRLGNEIWCGGEKRQKEEEKKGGRGRGFWILASLVLDYLLGVMVRVPRFVSEGCCRLAWCVSDVIA